MSLQPSSNGSCWQGQNGGLGLKWDGKGLGEVGNDFDEGGIVRCLQHCSNIDRFFGTVHCKETAIDGRGCVVTS